ncbi:hypothetical protein SDJN02_11904, partial [Cucurbita argyrosperma subsp. argyrosperma]
MRPIPSAVQAMSLTLPFSFPRGKIEDGKDDIAAFNPSRYRKGFEAVMCGIAQVSSYPLDQLPTSSGIHLVILIFGFIDLKLLECSRIHVSKGLLMVLLKESEKKKKKKKKGVRRGSPFSEEQGAKIFKDHGQSSASWGEEIRKLLQLNSQSSFPIPKSSQSACFPSQFCSSPLPSSSPSSNSPFRPIYRRIIESLPLIWSTSLSLPQLPPPLLPDPPPETWKP